MWSSRVLARVESLCWVALARLELKWKGGEGEGKEEEPLCLIRECRRGFGRSERVFRCAWLVRDLGFGGADVPLPNMGGARRAF